MEITDKKMTKKCQYLSDPGKNNKDEWNYFQLNSLVLHVCFIPAVLRRN